MNSINHCHVTSQVNAYTAEAFSTPITQAVEEIIDDLLQFGSITIGTTNYHVMDLYQYGDWEEQANLIFMTIRDCDAAKELAEKIITDAATYYFGESNPELALAWYEDKHSEY